ncbi:NUDIX pyrophosphatase [Bacteroidota bacterium]
MPEFISNSIQVHIAAKVKDGYKYLVLKRASDLSVYPDLWQVITGTIEGNDTALQTAFREIDEETGLKPIKLWTVPYVAVFFDVRGDQIHSSPVFGALVNQAKEVKLSEEHKDYKWCDYDECIKILELPSHKEGTKIFCEYILMNDREFMRDLMEQ